MNRTHTLVISALFASLGPLVGSSLYTGPGDSGEEILAEYQDLPTIAYVALPLELLGFAATAVLFACLVARTYAVAPVAAVTTAIAGATMLAIKIGSAGPIMVLIDSADDMDPATAELMVSLNDMAFVLDGLMLSVALTAAGIALLKTETPRFLGWWAAVVGPLGVVAGIAGVVKPEAYFPIPFLLLLIWMIALAIAAAMRPTAIDANGANPRHEHATATE